MAKIEDKEKAEKFVEYLLHEGEKVACDESTPDFKVSEENIPPFYDEELFKKGQEFYHRNIFAIYTGKYFGLLSVLAIPSILKILMFTKMSSTDYTAYRRYVATIFHVNIWYDYKFRPGSKLWQSITEVRKLHNSASTRSCLAGSHRINQKDMVLTQFGFIGIALTRPHMLGVQNATDDDWKALIHLWRVIGYVLGIEDRFNLCGGTVQETKDICNVLIDKVFRPAVEKRDPNFLQMTRYLTNGLWCTNPMLEFNVAMTFFYNLLTNRNTLENSYMPLTKWQKFHYYFTGLTVYSLRFRIFRWYHNHMKYVDFWLIENFPFLAYYSFGYSKSHVKILLDTNDKIK